MRIRQSSTPRVEKCHTVWTIKKENTAKIEENLTQNDRKRHICVRLQSKDSQIFDNGREDM